MGSPFFLVDAFTEEPFRGNPAGVCVLGAPAAEEWMQSVASEMKHAETAFLWEQEDGWNLRWFTPTVEVDLCGHATLASAHVLLDTGADNVAHEIRFHTKSGVLTARYEGSSIILDFPSEPADESELPHLPTCLSDPVWTGRNRMDWVVKLANEELVRSLRPDFDQIGELGLRGLIVTAKSQRPEYDFVSRFFAPQSGVPEDHATGSAHCALAPFWAERLGKSEMLAYQASPRGATVGVRLKGDRVELIGKAVTVLEGKIIC